DAQPLIYFFFSSRRRHTRFSRDWSSDVCSSDLELGPFGRDHAGLEAQRVAALDEIAEQPEAAGRRRDREVHRRLDLDVAPGRLRSEERRVGKEGRARGW